jgi:GntR family transcriptional regulator
MTETISFHPSVPRHHQIQRLLRSKIESGEWGEDEQVPGEIELAQRFRVSRNTVREALGALERDGLIRRQRGRGTFVRPRPAAAKPLSTVSNVLYGYEAKIRVVGIETRPALPHASQFLGIPRGEPVRRFVRVELVEGAPLSVVVNYLPVPLGSRVKAADLERSTMLEFLRDRLHVPIGRIRQSVEARMPDEEVASLLEIDLTQPVLYVQLQVWDERGGPVEVADTFYRADRYRYEVDMPRLPKRRLSKAGRGARAARGAPARRGT